MNIIKSIAYFVASRFMWMVAGVLGTAVLYSWMTIERGYVLDETGFHKKEKKPDYIKVYKEEGEA